MKSNKRVILFSALLAAAFSVSAQETNAIPATGTNAIPAATGTNTPATVTFEKDILPIFKVSCTMCHNTQKPRAGLSVETREATLKGSRKGAIVVPGNSSKSLLVDSVSFTASDPDANMPPANNKAKAPRLTSAEVALVRAWIDQGAK
jgi:uncharacterized membrane protein